MTRSRNYSIPFSNAQAVAVKLFVWFERHGRTLPWRNPQISDPYRTWLSEVMLQQTTVATVKKYFIDFTERWPTVDDLAKANINEVFHAWQGLGYYARARHLHACANKIVRDYQGRFPSNEIELRTLPGIGPYTAAAIASIAFNQPAAAVDTNIERVVARLEGIQESGHKLRRSVQALMGRMVPDHRPGDYVQAMMDLGSAICTPKQPLCVDCPLSANCFAYLNNQTDQLPMKPVKSVKPKRYGVIFWLENKENSAVFLRQRPLKGLLAGMIEIPSTPWLEKDWRGVEIGEYAPHPIKWRDHSGLVKHGFTHFDLELRMVTARISQSTVIDPKAGFWCLPAEFAKQAFPTLMKKVIKAINPSLLQLPATK